MKTKTLVLRHWEDVVFENRNQDYGAYVLRTEYSKRVILAWGITIALFATLIYAPSLLGVDATITRTPFPPADGDIRISPPPILPVKPKQIPQQQSVKSSSTQIVVTKEPVETSTTSVEPVASITDDTGTGGAIDGYVDGTSVEPAVPAVTVPSPPVIRDFAEVMPSYVGGYEAMMKFIKKKIHVPASFKYLGEGGTVYVRFVISSAGAVSDVEVVRGISKDCDKEAARVISIMPAWIAGMQNGTAVPVRMVLPIRFAKEN